MCFMLYISFNCIRFHVIIFCFCFIRATARKFYQEQISWYLHAIARFVFFLLSFHIVYFHTFRLLDSFSGNQFVSNLFIIFTQIMRFNSSLTGWKIVLQRQRAHVMIFKLCCSANLLAFYDYLLTALKHLISMANLKSDYMLRMSEINAARPVFNDVTATFFPCAFLDSHHIFTLEKRNWNSFYLIFFLFAFDREKISLKSYRF